MNQRSIGFLKTIIVLVACVALFIMIWFPLTEGRAENLDLLSIYFDSFILYGYTASGAFFLALYKAFKLLGYIGQKKVFSLNSVSALRSIKYCVVTFSSFIMAAGLYIRMFHNKEDDPAGFLAICIGIAFVSIVVVAATVVFENMMQNGIEIQSENEQLKRGQRNKLTV